MPDSSIDTITQLEEAIERGRQLQRELRSRRSWALLLLFVSLLCFGLGIFIAPLRLLLLIGLVGLIISVSWRRRLIPLTQEIDDGMVVYRTKLARQQAMHVSRVIREQANQGQNS